MPRKGKDEKNTSRRRFLKATGAVALTSAVAGCSSGGDSDGESTTSATTTTDEGAFSPDFDSYPYGINETQVDQARQVMEDAGYGPNNRYELNWLQYQDPSWEEMANTIRARLESAHIDMNINQADFGALLNDTEQGNHEAYTLGWVADYPQPRNFLQLVQPENTNYGKSGANGARLFWTEDANESDQVRQYMSEQYSRILDNPNDSEEAIQTRGEAAVNMEQALWESCALIPIYHQKDEAFWYDHVDYEPYGGMGASRQKANIAVNSLEGKDRLSEISDTFNSLDPAASGNTQSGAQVMYMFDAPLNYRNGTTEVENLLIQDYEISDDLTEYTFTLKEGVQFHDDYGELTAADVVYSIRRVMESTNSTNQYFPVSVLGIEHETDDDGNITEATGVEATGTYEFTLSLEQPFPYGLSVLAYGAFSVLPEGIVGDIDGYEGDMEYSEFSASNPVGCGPFQFVNWESGNGGEVNLDTFDDYHGDAASFEGVDNAIITDSSARYNYFINENADIAPIPTSQYDPSLVSVEETLEGGREIGTYGPMENDQTVNYSGVPTIDTYYVGFHMEKVPKAVRQAMAYVVNREQFVSNVFKERGAGAYHLEPPQVFPGGQSAYDQHYQG
ncbi:ABC transporter substrate-binding protein [Halobacterium sp. KA-6]|uniref:ABC transporter substrate-binding protein n=1 Tax=Halobacterium sp. KA-6 TaxID=2896368 RepID=UPI001E3A48DC|nr:ABC transporter substrate-binding protein [Halobacterium sp. KA-6]MCD2203034.1 ABC transporter substrate-binding protein [Halobacterium sp. KA-6]